MDFSKFSDAEFEPKEWINETFHCAEAKKSRENFASNLVMKLQLFIQEVNKSLEETSVQIVQTMPKVIREVDSINQEALLLKNKMENVQRDVQKVEQETAQAMESLLKLDSAKCRMLDVERALKEIDNWSTLTKDVDDVFNSGDPNLISSKLIAMQQSLKNLGEKVPEYVNRRDYLERLKDQFVNLISPSVVAAFTGKSVETVQYFSKIFSELERMSELQKYYQKCLKADIQRQWKSLVSSPESQELPTLIENFYDCLLSTWFAQNKWCSHSFKSPSLMILETFGTTLKSLDPSIESLIVEKLDSYKDKIKTLIIMKQNSDNFCKSIESAVASADLVTSSPVVLAVLREVYNPFRRFIAQYRQYAQSELIMKLSAFDLDQLSFSSDGEHLVESVLEPICQEAATACDNCNSLTNGLGVALLVKALESFFGELLMKLNKQAKKFESSCDRSVENWDQFHLAFQFLRFSGELLYRVDKLKDSVQVQFNKALPFVEQGDLVDVNDLQSFDSAKTRSSHVFESLIIGEAVVRESLLEMNDRLTHGSRLMSGTYEHLNKFNELVYKLAVSLSVGPLEGALNNITTLTSWSSARLGEALTQAEDLPNFSLSPQEYITKVGQFLMSFAHHLEPLLATDNVWMLVGLRHFKLPYTDKQDAENVDGAVRLWIESVVNGLMHTYAESILNIPFLSASGSRQLLSDIVSDYLCNVVEDLAIPVAKPLQALRELIALPAAKYAEDSARYPQRIAFAIREIRRIK